MSRLPTVSRPFFSRVRKPIFVVGTLAIAACTSTNLETPLRCSDCPEVQVVRVIDGDTLDSTRGRVRLFGVDTPERGQRCASEATDRFQELAGNIVRLEDGPRATDSFDRLLAYVYTQDGLSIDETLIREGLATAWTRDGQHRDYLVGLERGSSAGGCGVSLVKG